MEFFFNMLMNKILDFLTKDTLCSESKRNELLYGLQVFSYNILIVSSILILALIFHCFFSTLLVFIVFGILRILAGGYHFNSMGKCFLTTTTVIIGTGKLAHIIQFSLLSTIFLCVVLNIVLLSHTPKGTEKNPFSATFSKLQKQRLQITSIILSCMALCILQFRSCILLSMIVVVIFLLPVIIKKQHAHKSI